MVGIINRLHSARSLLNWLQSLGSPVPGLDADLLDGNHASAFALLSGASFTGQVNISRSSSGSNLALYTADDAGLGPQVTTVHTTATPAANDVPFRIINYSYDSAANLELCGVMGVIALDLTSGSEDAAYFFQTPAAGAFATRLYIGAGLWHPSVTGGDKGNNTINFGTIYEDNNRVATQALTNTFTVRQNITPPNADFGLYIARSGQVAPHIRLDMTSSANTGDRFIDFQNNTTGTIGTITVNGASNVSYNTSSDPRMKKDLTPLDLTESVDRIKALKLWKGKWKADDAPFRGILTTELQHVIPEAVTGPEDGIEEEWVVGNEEQPRIVIRAPDEDGLKKIEAKAPKDADLHPLSERISPQMWDASKCMPDVMGALQWALGRIETLEARIAALESA